VLGCRLVDADFANQIRNTERPPVEEKDCRARVIFRKSVALRTSRAKQPIQSVKVIEITRENAEELEFVPPSA